MNTICSAEDITIFNKEGTPTEHISFEIHEGHILGLIDKDGNAARLLQAIGGFYKVSDGQILYADHLLTPKGSLSTNIQYVPDDIVCYPDLTVEDFIIGAAACSGTEALHEQIRLIKMFGIDIKEHLLNMTFEHNRLIAYIMAISAKPKLLLIEEPYDMISTKGFMLLSRELVTLHKNGTAIVFSAHSFDDLKFPCGSYIFMSDNDIRNYERIQLPHPAKVITIRGGHLANQDTGDCTILSSGNKQTRFLYHNRNKNNLILMLYRTGCKDFLVDELSMEEAVYEDYSRWM